MFLGDLVDRGPDTPGVLRTVMTMVEAGTALCVPGNHDVKLMRALRGKKVQLTHGLAESMAHLEAEPEEFRCTVADFIDARVSHHPRAWSRNPSTSSPATPAASSNPH